MKRNWPRRFTIIIRDENNYYLARQIIIARSKKDFLRQCDRACRRTQIEQNSIVHWEFEYD